MAADYIVFIDESFYQWFGQIHAQSSLCYGAITIPQSRLGDLERFEESAQAFLRSRLPAGIATKDPDEFKYSDFRHLDAATFDEMGEKLRYFLKKNNAFIFGFFIPAEGFLNYRLRDDFFDAPEKLAALSDVEKSDRIQRHREEMLELWETTKLDGKRDLGLIETFYHTFCGFVLHFQARTLGKSFEIVYDSRNEDEDRALHEGFENNLFLQDRLHTDISKYYKGYRTSTSLNSPGLRLADWIAGETRTFFFRNPELIEANSKLEVLSASPNPKMTIIGHGAPYYEHPFPESAQRCLEETNTGFMTPKIKERFAAGLVTYYAKYGEARHLSVMDKKIFDMAD